MYGDSPLPEDDLTELIADVWALRVKGLRYERVGFGSYHWRGDAGPAPVFVTADPIASPWPIVASYELAQRLVADGLDFVRGPLPTVHGTAVGVWDGWYVSLWPWVDGRSSDYGRPETEADLDATLTAVRRLHDHSGIDPIPELIDDFGIDERTNLEAALADPGSIDRGWYGPEVSERLAANAARVRDDLARYDALVAAIRQEGGAPVITHGEPHAANVVHTDRGAKLIDWDTVRWGPRERDLWMLTPGGELRAAYGDYEMSLPALDAYELRWRLTEVALYVTDLPAATAKDPDSEAAIAELRDYLPL